MNHLINLAIEKGAKLYGSISGGKDGQAMVKTLYKNDIELAGLIHADLGRIEWPESLPMCHRSADEFNLPLHVVTRTDGRDMVDHWKNRLEKLRGTGKPFWSSSSNRYCTSDEKRDPINKFLTNCGYNFVISCEGIRAQESDKRKTKPPIEIRWRITSTYYEEVCNLALYEEAAEELKLKLKNKEITKDYYFDMLAEYEWQMVELAIENYHPEKRLALTFFPIFNMTLDEVWATYGMTVQLLETARFEYNTTGKLVTWWPFHPAYAYGNDRVSCMFCVLGSKNDLGTAAHHNPSLLNELIGMEDEGKATFKNNWSLKELL